MYKYNVSSTLFIELVHNWGLCLQGCFSYISLEISPLSLSIFSKVSAKLTGITLKNIVSYLWVHFFYDYWALKR